MDFFCISQSSAGLACAEMERWSLRVWAAQSNFQSRTRSVCVLILSPNNVINCRVAVHVDFSLIGFQNSLVLGAVQSEMHVSCLKCFLIAPLGCCTDKQHLYLLTAFAYSREIFWGPRCYTITRNRVMADAYFSQYVKANLHYQMLLYHSTAERKECVVPICVHSRGKCLISP